MGEIVFNEFNDTFAKYHPNDFSLVCNNNILYYGGDTQTIFGNIRINYGDSFNIGNFPIRNIDPAIWRLPSHLLFFNIRESIKRSYENDIISSNEIEQFKSLMGKSHLTDNDKINIMYEIDYYFALNSMEKTLREGLHDYYAKFHTAILPTIMRVSRNQASEGILLVQDKLQNIALKNIQREENIISTLNNNIETDSGENRGHQRVNRKSSVHFSDSMFSSGNATKDFIKDSSAYINAIIILLITVSVILIALMVIFNL